MNTTIYTSDTLPHHWIVRAGDGTWWLVPAIADGWVRRSQLPHQDESLLDLVRIPAAARMGTAIPI